MLSQRRLIEAPKEDENAAPATTANLQNLRLTREEMSFKTVPLISGLHSATVADLQALPEVRQSGSFSAFTVASTNPQQQWVVGPPNTSCIFWMCFLKQMLPYLTCQHILPHTHNTSACCRPRWASTPGFKRMEKMPLAA